MKLNKFSIRIFWAFTFLLGIIIVLRAILAIIIHWEITTEEKEEKAHEEKLQKDRELDELRRRLAELENRTAVNSVDQNAEDREDKS